MARSATALEIARYGHIAAFLRQKMAERGMRAADLSEAIGLDRSSTIGHRWVHGFGAPSRAYRQKLAKAFGMKPDFFAPRDGSEQLPAVIEDEPAPRSVVQRITETLSFSVLSDGNARIRLDITLPVEQAAPLLRTLLDTGILAGAPI